MKINAKSPKTLTRLRPGFWRFCKPYLLKHRSLIYVTIFIVPLLSALNLLQPYLVKVAIDAHIMKKDFLGLRIIVLIYLLVFVAEYLLNFLQTYLLQLSGQKIVFNLREDLFRKLHQLDIDYYTKTPVGVTLTRLTGDCEVISELFSSGIVSLGWDLLRLGFIVIAMVLLNWKFALIAFSVVPLLFGLVVFFRRRLRESYDRVREKVALLNAFIQEMTNGMRIVQAFSQERNSLKKFTQINDDYKNANLDAVRYDAYLYALVEGLASVAVGLMIWFGSGSLVSGLVSFGVLVAFIEYIQRFFIPIRDLSAKVAVIQAARVALEKIITLMETPSLIVSPENPVPHAGFETALTLRDVSFSYEPGKPVVSHVNITLKKGAQIALIGVTGSGKSTLFRLLNRTYDVEAGAILLDGIDLKNLDLSQLRSFVGIVSQDVFLFSGSIADNIRLFSSRFSAAEVIAAAQAVGAHALISRLPREYDYPVAQRGENLSMGERQLIALARMALFNPPILLLDEATAHIDPMTTRLLQKGMEKLSQNRTLLIAAHRLETIKQADYILVMHHGSIKEEGTRRDLLQSGGLFSKLYRLETVLT